MTNKGYPNIDPDRTAFLYEIVDPLDGIPIYVGFTVNIYNRKHAHLSLLRSNKHHNDKLQNLHNKRERHGLPLVFRQIAKGPSHLIIRGEVLAIFHLRGDIGNRCCNMTNGGEGTVAVPKSVRINARAKAISDPRYIAKASENAKKQWADPVTHNKMVESLKAGWSDPEVRERRTKALKKAWENPEARKRASESAKLRWAKVRAAKRAAHTTQPDTLTTP